MQPFPPRVSVIMPIYNHSHFVSRAIESLLAQTLSEWELLVVDDGSTDGSVERVEAYVSDARITLVRLGSNQGLGVALNRGLDEAKSELIAYLPADDIYYRDHLQSLTDALEGSPTAQLAISGLRHSYARSAEARAPGKPIQLVQAMHRVTDARWTERSELTTDDLGRMFWDKLSDQPPIESGTISCEWVDHPHQRHKVIQEPIGGINTYRDRYRVQTPLCFHSTVGHRIDEIGRYRAMRETPIEPKPDGLKILLVGELAYNPERVLALAEAGHRLYGLWMPEPYWYNWVGPLPFGHVEHIDRAHWPQRVREIRPDVIYGLLNWQAVPFVHQVQSENPGIPFIWHFKEGPFICLEHGYWQELIDLYERADGRIYSSVEMEAWFDTLAPRTRTDRPSLVLDGDLPKRDLLGGERSARLSDHDNEVHTVVPGRPIGLHPETVAELAAGGIHLHFYGEFTHGQWAAWIERTRGLAGRFFHLHPNVDQENWVAEFSQYDAGWLHFIKSHNHGEMMRANWDDLNLPARMATLAAAGLPMLQRANPGHIVATQAVVRDGGLGLFFDDMAELAEQLHDRGSVRAIADSVWAARDAFTFDHHVERLTAFMQEVAGHSARTQVRAA